MSYVLARAQKNTFIGGEVRVYLHKRTRCEIIHFYNDDNENVYMFAVPSYVNNNTGVAHILEHSVLSGSERYRVKSPFFLLEQGSCRSYLNASTYPDRTLYTGASTVKDDLFNLLAMYGDAVWFPLLEEEVFRQESFYLQFDHPKKFRTAGVVYNEMKGVYSDKYTLVENAIHEHMFPDTNYRFDAGGNPKNIPELSYEQFLNYHNTYYRPEHTKIILYGNIETSEYLDFFEKEFFARWNKKVHSPLESQTLQERINLVGTHSTQDSIKLIEIPVSKHAAPNSGSLDISWLIGNSNDLDETLLIRVLHFALLGIPGALLRKRIMQSGLVDDISPLSGQSSYLLHSYFTIGGTGLQEKNYQSFHSFVFESLEEIVKNGIPERIIKAALHRIEFSTNERLNSTGGKIRWLAHIASKWLYREDPLLHANSSESIKRLKTLVAEPRVLEDFIRTRLIENMHRSCIGTIPNKNYEKKTSKDEIKYIQNKFFKANIKYWEDMQEKILRRQASQDEPKNILSIPQLQKTQLPKKIEIIPHIKTPLTHSENSVLWIPHSVREVLYLCINFDITELLEKEEDRKLLPSFAACLSDIGIRSVAYDEFSIELCINTGRLISQSHNLMHTDGSKRAFLSIKVSVLPQHLAKAMDLVEKILGETDFNNSQRLKEIMSEGKSNLKNRIIEFATTLAIMKSAQNYSFNAHIDDDWNGLSQLRWLLSHEDDATIGNMLKKLSCKVFTRSTLSCVAMGDTRHQDKVLGLLEKIIHSLPIEAESREKSSALFEYQSDEFGKKIITIHQHTQLTDHAIVLPTKVAYNAMVMPSVNYKDPHFAHYKLASKLIAEKLLEKIRLGYGAYGADASVLGGESLFICYTFRDPNIRESFSIFQDAMREVAKGEFEQHSLNSHIVGTVGDSLVSLSPHAKIDTLFYRKASGIGDDLRQDIRDSLLAASIKDVRDAASALLEGLKLSSVSSVCNEKMLKSYDWDHVEYAPY